MTTDYSHGWVPPATIQNFRQQFEENADTLYAYMNGHLNRYRTERDTAQGQLAAARQTIDNLEEQNTQLDLNLNIARAGHTKTSTTPIASPLDTSSTFRSEKFPDPEKFDGTRAKLPGFVTQLRMKLEVNHDRFRNDGAKVIYSISRLEGRALDQVVPLVNTNPSAPFSSVTSFLAYLDASFGDPDPRGTARRELNKLKQGSGDFATYYSKFLRIISYLDYNEAAKIDALAEGLSEDIKDALSYRIDAPKNLEEYAFTLMKIDNQIRGRKAEQRASHNTVFQTSPPASGHPSHVAGGFAPMDLSAIHTQVTSRPPLGERYVSNNGVRKLSHAEKLWRRSNFLCMYCAGADHKFNTCPTANRPKNNQPTLTGAQLVPVMENNATPPAQNSILESSFH